MKGQNDTQLLEALYSFCDTGYVFEKFLKLVLEAIGLQEVVVTQASNDGGIDLIAVRPGIESLSNVDQIVYQVQAKRLKPGSSVSIRDVRALRGVMKSGECGLFITTGRFTSGAESFAEEDPSRPILLMDGLQVIDVCKSHGIGIGFYPYFDSDALNLQMKTEPKDEPPGDQDADWDYQLSVSVNDVRARILPMPKEIIDQLPLDAEYLQVNLNGDLKELRFNRTRRYVAGVTEVFRESGFLLQDNSRRSGQVFWSFDAESCKATARAVAAVELPTG